MKIPNIFSANWNIRPLTALAIGSGFGAALGMRILPLGYIGILFGAALFFTRRSQIILAVGLFIAAVSGSLHYRHEHTLEKALLQRPAWVEGSFRCTDTRLSKIPDLEMPKQQRGILTLDGIGSFPVTATFPDKMTPPFFGDIFTVEGQLYPASPPALTADDKGQITGCAEPPFGKIRRMQIRHAQPAGNGHSFQRSLLLWRDHLLKRLLAHIDGSVIRSQTARLFLGASAGAPPEIRNRYVSAGTIHLFAVSGMHVAVLAALLLFLLRPLPFRLRYCAVAAMIWLYVFAAGGAYSAIRAGAMISTWALCRAMLLYTPGWNILCLGWSFILWFDPAAVADLGMLYSFAITAALLLGAERFRELRRTTELPLMLMTEHNAETEKFRVRHLRTARRLALFFSAMIAFAASSGISLYAQSLFAPGGIAANLLLPLLTPLLFAAMTGKMILGWIAPWLDRIGAVLITLIFSLLDQLCAIVVSVFGSMSVICPGLWEIALFYAALFFALGSRRFLSALTGAAVALTLLCSWPLRAALHQPQTWILSPGCDKPAMVVQIPRGSERALILDVPDFNCGIAAAQEARRLGATQAEVWLDAGTVAAGGGLAALRSGGLRIIRLHLPEKRSAALKAVIAKSAPEQIAEENRCSFAEFSGIAAESKATDTGREVRLRSGNRTLCELTLPWSTPPVWYRK